MISTSKSKTRTQPLAVLDARADKKNMLRKKLAFFKLHRKHIEHQNVNAQLQEVTRQGGTIVAELKTLEEKKACALRLSTLKSIEQQMAPMVQFNKNIEPFCRVQHWVGLSSADVARLKELLADPKVFQAIGPTLAKIEQLMLPDNWTRVFVHRKKEAKELCTKVDKVIYDIKVMLRDIQQLETILDTSNHRPKTLSSL